MARYSHCVSGICRKRTRSRHPEVRMLQPLPMSPFPVLGFPEAGVLVSTGAHEFQKFIIGHRECVHRKSRHVDFLRAEFIVPAECLRQIARLAQRGYARGIVTARGFGAGRGSAKVPRLGNFSRDRQIVQQIRQRLRVHQPVFDRDMQQRAVGDLRSACCAAPRRHSAPSSSASRTRRLYFSTRAMFGQSPGMSVGSPSPTGSIPNAKSLSKSASRDCKAQRGREQIPVKRLQVTEIKDQPMTFRDRAVVKRVRRQALETARRSARVLLPIGNVEPGEGAALVGRSPLVTSEAGVPFVLLQGVPGQGILLPRIGCERL